MRFGEDRGFERSFHRQTSEMAHRDNGRITLHSPEVAAALFERVGPFVPAEMGGRYVWCAINFLYLWRKSSCWFSHWTSTRQKKLTTMLEFGLRSRQGAVGPTTADVFRTYSFPRKIVIGLKCSTSVLVVHNMTSRQDSRTQRSMSESALLSISSPPVLTRTTPVAHVSTRSRQTNMFSVTRPVWRNCT